MLALFSISTLATISAVVAQNVTQIMVGSSGSNPFMFTPANVTVAEGDIVTFTFSGVPGNHSVTQSSFTAPCDPLGNGFDSGNILIPAGTSSGFPTWNLTVTNASQPIWFFCKQLVPQPHCNSGMVGSINAPATGQFTFDAFKQAAQAHQGNSGQSVGFLVGQAASASAVPGPFSGSITGFGLPNPSATAPSVVSSSAAASPAATSASSASKMHTSGVFAMMAAIIGLALA
ncbi:hypothetical protein A7U60_g5215 [Sanghuangporus baumii]|uniref:Cupredoxin n=1 Tax=Sanghuangporus baumii TaxID=108892 RepID=A0A9Q5HXI1_SANBA|nr:hypothetical protein A7U60_g5215 [Sanghuangporus baumii]